MAVRSVLGPHAENVQACAGSGLKYGMREFALTGGIGSGKSTVADGLVARGVALIDADRIVRELQAPGGSVLAAMVEHFGDGILAESGELDRQAVADIVFNDEDQLKKLGELVHPAVAKELVRRREELAETDAIVLLDIPLLVNIEGEFGRKEYEDFLGVLVVDVDPELAVERLVEHRGFSADDARARMANQATREQRLAKADHVIDNSGSLSDLESKLDAAWAWMQEVAGA